MVAIVLIQRIAAANLKLPEEIRDDVSSALRQAISEYIISMNQYNIIRVPRVSGDLFRSGMTVLNRSSVKGTSFQVYYGFAIGYAKDVDKGQPPGTKVDVRKIRTWCVAVGIPAEAAFFIARAIFDHGTVQYKRGGSLFFEDGVARAKLVLQQELDRAFRARKLRIQLRLV